MLLWDLSAEKITAEIKIPFRNLGTYYWFKFLLITDDSKSLSHRLTFEFGDEVKAEIYFHGKNLGTAFHLWLSRWMFRLKAESTSFRPWVRTTLLVLEEVEWDIFSGVSQVLWSNYPRITGQFGNPPFDATLTSLQWKSRRVVWCEGSSNYFIK